jgi:hypothetical protein
MPLRQTRRAILSRDTPRLAGRVGTVSGGKLRYRRFGAYR